MRLFTTLILIVIHLDLLGQETKFVLKEGQGFTEEYDVLKSDKKVKHGTYVKYRQPFGQYVIIESGAYQNGEKHGQWETFYNETSRKTWNKLKEKGNFVNGKKNGLWTYYYLDTAANTTNVEKSGANGKSKSVNVSIDQKNEKLRQAGMFLNDKRVAEWVSFDHEGEVFQRYNFSKSKLVFEKSLEDSTSYNANRKPLFIGGLLCLSNFLANNVNYVQIVSKVDRDSTYATINFIIDEQGKTQSVDIVTNYDNKPFKDEIQRLISLTDFYWLPGLKEGLKIALPCKLIYNIVRSVNDQNFKSWRTSFEIVE
jgi:antitoxin component YwqK of YwqJK toxin-antitoxin module